MANNSNVSNNDYRTTGFSLSFLEQTNANVDANYGPWESIPDYEAWLSRKGVNIPVEGVLIAVQPTSTNEVTLYVRSNSTWKPVGSGGTGTDDIGYEYHDVDVDILEKKVVSTSANQGLNLEQQAHARANINAADADNVIPNGSYLCTINNTSISQGDNVTLQGIDSGGSSQPSISTRSDVASNSTALVESSGIYTFVTSQLASKANAADLALKADKTELSGKADKGSTLSEYGINNAYTKTETNTAISDALGDYVKKNNAQVTGNLSVNGSTTLGDSASDTITLNGSLTANGDVNLGKGYDDPAEYDAIMITGDTVIKGGGYVAIGETDHPKKVYIKGETNITGDTTINGDIILGTATTQSQTSDSLTVINGSLTLADIAGTNGGVLRVGSNGVVYADPSSYITGSIMVDTYDDLPTSGIQPGEVRFIRDTGKISTALQVVADTKLYVSIPNVYVTEANANKRVLEEMCTEERPLVQYSTFLNNFSEIVDEHNAEDVYGDYPAIPYREHKLTESAGDDLYVIPVQHDTYGKIMIAISKVSGKAWIVPTSSVGAINTWYVDEVGSTGGLSTGSLIEITDNYDDLPDDLTNVREFMTFGGSVIWSK